MKFNHLEDEKFLEVMCALAEASGQESTPFKEKIYAQGLDDIPIELVQAAAWVIIKTRVFATFPKIGEIRDAVGGKAEDIAEVQATAVWKAIKKHGSVRSVVFDDPITMAVIQQAFGGWQKLCAELMEDQLQWFIKDFARHYIAFKRSNIKYYGMLPGWADPISEGPALIGDPIKALAVLDQGASTVLQSVSFVGQIADKMAVSS